MNGWLIAGCFVIYWIGVVIGTYIVGRFAIRPRHTYDDATTGEGWIMAAVLWPFVAIAAVPGFVFGFPLWWAWKRASEQRIMASERKRKL